MLISLLTVVVPRPSNYVELTADMNLEDAIATDLMMGLDDKLTEENLRERLHNRKVHEFGCGNGVDEIEQSVLDDTLLGTDRKTMQDEYETEKKRRRTAAPGA